MNQNSNAPLDKGRVAVAVEKYQSGVDQNNQPVTKNRYASVGRATWWPGKNGSQVPNVEIELDTMPIGISAPVKLYVFWESENQNQQGQQNPQQQGGYQQNPQQQGGYQQNPQQQGGYSQQRGR